jgi:endoribonuclease Dicer
MTKQVLHLWQSQSLDRCKETNAIVQIPTGGGKTLIASHAIDYFTELFPSKKALFVVPTRPLVEQQANYCEIHCCPKKNAARISGASVDAWDREDWQDCILSHDILVGTPEVFRNAFLTRKLEVCTHPYFNAHIVIRSIIRFKTFICLFLMSATMQWAILRWLRL